MEHTHTISPAYQAQQFLAKAEKCFTLVLKDAAEYIQNGWMIIWQHHHVFTIKVTNAEFETPSEMHSDMENHLQRLRAFNDEKEWHIWKTQKSFAGRKREEQQSENTPASEGTTIEAIDVQIPLRAVIAKQIPNQSSNDTLGLTKRSYIQYNEFNLAYYADQRFVAITKIGKETQS